MACSTVEQRMEKILENLGSNSVKTIVLEGVAGVGKTWTARRICDQLESNGLFDIILWLFLNREHDVLALYKNIARQLSILAIIEERRDDGYREEMVEGDNWSLEKLKQKISEVLANKRCLLILDDEGNKMNEEDILPKLEALLPQKKQVPFKVLITTKSNSRHFPDGAKTIILVERLTEEVSMQLLYERAEISDSEFQRFGSQFEAIIYKTTGLPSAIVMIAELLRYLREHDAGNWTFETALEEVAYNEKYGQNNILQSLCMLPSTITTGCLWNSRQLFRDQGSVHYNALIAYWILEGYHGDVDNIEKTYANGHSALMELVKCDMLTEQEDNFVAMEGALLEVDYCHNHGFGETTSLGLTSVFDGDMRKCFERITWTDGMIKSLGNDDKCQTLLLDGNHLSREVPDSLFSKLQGLQVLGLFNPKFKSVPSSLSKLQKLHVLVLRGCCLLENVDDIRELKRLTVLEISGASSLEKIPDDIFQHMPDLQSLNLSDNQITSLPNSIFQRSKLRRLILRKCSCVKVLPTLRELNYLEDLVLSGATSLKSISDRSLQANSTLLFLDLSHTKIERIPLLHQLEKLNRLSLRGCSRIARLPPMKSLTSLQILEVSCILLKEIPDEFLDSEALITVNLSGSGISQLPSISFDPCNLYLRGCSQLKKLPSTAYSKKIELIDISGAIALKEIEDNSFEHLRFLRHLDLSQTKVKILPALSNLGNLCQLLLKDCSSLEALPETDGLNRLEVLDLSGASSLRELKHLNYENLRRLLLKGCSKLVELPQLKSLEKLEVLDLSGCKALEHMQDSSFEQMAHLWMVDLSETGIKSLPPLPSPSKLCRLILRDCNKLEKLPHGKSLTKLEELDLGGASALEQIQAQSLEHAIHLQILNLSRISKLRVLSMVGLHNLTMLSLQGCSELEGIPMLENLGKLEIMDLSGTKMRHLPTLSCFSNLRKLMLRGCSNIKRLIHLESLTHLEVLDLFGTGIEEFPYEISKLTCLQRLDIPDMNGIQLDWGKIKFLPVDLNLEECSFPELAETAIENDKPSITVTGTKLFHVFKRSPSLFKQFHFSVCSPEQSKKGDNLRHGDEIMYQDIDAQTRRFPLTKENSRFLEIRGFRTFPIGIEDVIRCAEFLSLIENDFISCLYDLGAEKIKACWIERCNGVVSILTGEENVLSEEENLLSEEEKERTGEENGLSEEENVLTGEENVLTKEDNLLSEEEKVRTGEENGLSEEDNVLAEEKMRGRLGDNLEILCVSNMANFKSLCSRKLLPKEFTNLKELYLDCCPKLVNIFSSSQVPENLEILQIKFCDRVKSVFGDSIVAEYTVQKLHTLDLLELPELKSIGGVLPSIQILKVRECPNLLELETDVELDGRVQPVTFKNLKELYLDSCPMLVNVFSSSYQAENLEILLIKFCINLETVFEGNAPAKRKLPNLRSVHLWNLPKLKRFGEELAPSQLTPKVRDCPRLQLSPVT